MSNISFVFQNIPIIQKKLLELKRIYQNICPYEDERAEKIAVSALKRALLVSVISVILFFTANLLFCGATVYIWLSTAAVGYFAFTQTLLSKQRQMTKKFQESLSDFFLNVSHYYQSEHSVLNALSKGAASCDKDIQITARFLADILTSEKAEDKIYDFVTDANKNLYLKLFLQQCYECFEKGDTKNNNISVFRENIENFRVDMLRSKIENEKNDAKLTGLVFVIWFPVLMMGFIRKFGLTLTENMSVFYSKYGLFIECLGLITSLIVYYSLNKTKFQQFKTIQIKQIYYDIQETFRLFSNPKEGHFSTILKSVSCNIPLSVCYTKILCDGICGVLFCLILVVLTAVQNRTIIYPSQLVLVACGGLVSFLFPLKVVLLRQQYKKDREHEIDAIQLLILSEMHRKTITLAELLAKMERLACYYKSAIGECLNMLSFNQTKSLKKLKRVAEKEHDTSLSNIVDMLLSVDRIGIKKAFEELKINRQLNIEERHILTDIKADKKKNALELASMLPSAIAIGLYVIAPFIFYVSNDFDSVTDVLNSINGILW